MKKGDPCAMKTIRELRQERGLSQNDLAIQIGVHPQAVYLWESGRRMPLVPQIRKLGRLFGICSDEIMLAEPVSKTTRTPRGSPQGSTES
jgi:DNA-binding XRE family transcriptional regulator